MDRLRHWCVMQMFMGEIGGGLGYDMQPAWLFEILFAEFTEPGYSTANY